MAQGFRVSGFRFQGFRSLGFVCLPARGLLFTDSLLCLIKGTGLRVQTSVFIVQDSGYCTVHASSTTGA